MASVAGNQEWRIAIDAEEAETLQVIRAAQIEPRAFEPLYREFAGPVLVYCRRRLGDPELAADATSQVFINALRALPRYRPDERRVRSSFRSWLFSIAHNVVVDSYRRHRSDRSLDEPDSEGVPKGHRYLDRNPLPDEVALANDEARSIWRCLATLPERQRAVVELRLLGFNRHEIVETLGMSEAAVRSAQFRGFATLRAELDALWKPDQEDWS